MTVEKGTNKIKLTIRKLLFLKLCYVLIDEKNKQTGKTKDLIFLLACLNVV